VLVEAVEGLQRVVVELIGEKGKGSRGRIYIGRVTKEKGTKKKVVVEEGALTNLYSLVEEEEEVGPILEGA